jgi:superfamily II DNA or RNA helicase
MFDPVRASNNIKDEFISYISTSFSFSDLGLRRQFEEQLKSIISKGPYLETNDVFVSGKSIKELIDEGILSPLFEELEKNKINKEKRILPIDRPLYFHQEKSIRTIVGGNNAVISTGTGSGKTNCFLIPVINELLREKEAGTLGPGVRALFIYPMNALANDQLKNIRKLLMDYEDITFGVYNGGTEYEEDDALKVYESMFANEPIEKLRHPLKNELLSRSQMKKTPPNILFTNYAMLEHLLFRPNDDTIFSKSDFKYVVLDEAHIYSGATGIETAILLRRLRARISSSRETQFILTSATLGTSKDSDDDIVKFAVNLCGTEFKKENIIRADRQKYVYNSNGVLYPFSLICELADEKNVVKEILDKYGIKHGDGQENELLYDFLNQSAQYHIFRKNIQKVTSLNEICKILGASVDECIAFISLCSRAVKNGKSLVDARYHFFIRSLEGCYIALTPKKNLFLNRQKTYDDYAVFEVAICDDCGKYALVGKEQNGYLIQTSKRDDKVEYYYLFEDENDEIEDDETDDTSEERYYLCPHCGAMVEENRIKNKPCDCNSNEYIKVVKAKRPNNDKSTGLPKCGNCHRGRYNRFYLGNDAATSVLATSLYEELPELSYEEGESNQPSVKINVFARAVAQGRKTAKKTGRQFLVFSDSRQEAAKFACYLGKSYDEFLRRRGICHIAEEQRDTIINSVFTISDFVTKLTSYFSNKRSFASSNSDNSNLTTKSSKNAWVAMLNELARVNASTSLTSLGVLQFEYLGNTEELISQIAKTYNSDYQSVKDLLNLLIFEVVKAGAICTNSDTDIDDNDREYIFYTPSQRFITKLQSPDKKKATVTDWIPRNKKNNKDEYYKTNKLYYVIKYLDLSEKDAAEFLEQYYDYLTDPENGNEYCMEDKNNDGTFVLPAKYFRVRIFGDPNAKWYKCSRCGKVSPYHLHGHCITVKCDAKANEVDPAELRKDNHFSELYFSDRMTPLFIKEHTAQLSKRESAEYQEQFIKKEINALSCSTTFEMGVDVGDLETVFLRDVPPLPSNYAQRAGRAGRSVNAAAYCLTFAKLSSHDLSFFKEPEKMINGVILPPLFKVDNEKIVKRHIYAVALSMFFAMKPEYYNSNDASKFINDKGYTEFFDWLDTKPIRLTDLLKRSIPDIDNLHVRIGIDDYSWIEDFKGPDGVFTVLIREYENNVKQFEDLIKKFKRENELDKALKCERKMRHYMNNKLIDFLARGNILPRYGFPVDTVELEQNATAANINKLRLSRDLSIAIAEYAPSSEVIADGKLYTSRYIKKSNVGNNKKEWKTAYLGKCQNEECQATNYSITPISKEGVKCSCCGTMLYPMDFSESIEPVSGFVTEREAKEVPLSRQEKNYKSEDVYIGNTESKTIDRFSFKYNGISVDIESTVNDSLMVKSYNNFYVCPKCGYALAEDETITGDAEANKLIKNKAHKIVSAKKHESLFGQYDCDCQELIRYSMHHVFNTDVAKINFGCDTSDYKTMVSTMYAILYAISDYLNIERRDIKACLSWKIVNHTIDYSIIIYDAVPGGAGHSRRLVTNDGIMLQRVLRLALHNMESCSCDPSCYNCLRSYDNQKIHEELDRKLAAKFLSQLIGTVEVVSTEKGIN